MAYEIEVDDARRDTAVTRFRSSWDARLSDYETSLSLLASPAENDFAGMVEIIDESYVDDLVADLAMLLKGLGKIDEVKRFTLHELIDAAKTGALEEVFGTGTAAVISPVGKLRYENEVMVIGDGGIGPVSQRLYDTVTGIQSGAVKDPYGNWHVCVDD